MSRTLLAPPPWLRRSFFLLAATAGAGCSLFTSLSGLTGGADGLDGATMEGGSDRDGDGDADASNDAAPAVDAGRFCEQIDATFCEDWDDAVPGTRWQVGGSQNVADGFSTDASSSPPRSLWASTEPLIGPSSEAFSNRGISFAQNVTQVAYAFDVLLEKRGAGDGLVVFAVDLHGGDGFDYATEVVLGDTSDGVQESKVGPSTAYNTHRFSKQVPIGIWTRIAVTLTRLPTTAYHLTTKLAGDTVIDEDLTLFTGSPGGSPAVTVGAAFLHGPSPPYALHLDNITFDAR